MRKVVTCYKWVIDEADIKVDEMTRELKMKNPAYKISPYDRNAIEAGVQIAEKSDGLSVVLTAGTELVRKSRKDVLSSGPKEGYAVIDPDMEEADSLVTASVLGSALKKMGDVDIVLCGEGSGDVYAQQVGPRIAAFLGWPVISYAEKIEVQDDRVIVQRTVTEGVEVIEATLPVVITVAGDSNTPRVPTLKMVMEAGKKPFIEWYPTDVGVTSDTLKPGLKKLKVIGNIADRKQMMMEGDVEKAVDETVRRLIQDGVLS
jgi:electron transfer flavoprotein beta subunit